MKTIRFDSEIYQEIAQQLGRVSETVNSTQRSAASLRRVADLFIPKKLGVHNELQLIENRIKQKYTEAIKLRQNVLVAAGNFTKCENKLSGKDEKPAEVKADSIWDSPPFKWIDDVLDFFGIGKYERNYVDPGIEKEKARDAEMQEELRDLLSEDEFSESTWRSATMEERQQMLESAIKRMNTIYGTNVSTKINYFQDDWSDGILRNGTYEDSSRRVSMNTFNMTDNNYERVMTTLMHEMRHAYQHQVVRQPDEYTVSKENAQAWEDNFYDYKTIDRDGNDAYLDQPIEQDARDFSKGVFSG